MKKIFEKAAQDYISLQKRINKLEDQCGRLSEQQNKIFYKPFTRFGVNCNAQYAFSAILDNPDTVFESSTNLRFLRGSGLRFSEDSYAQHISRIYGHFKKCGVLVKKKNKYVLNPVLKAYYAKPVSPTSKRRAQEKKK